MHHTLVVSVVVVLRWGSTNGLIYMTCGSGVEVSVDKMEVVVGALSEGLFLGDGFNWGESCSSDDDGW